MIYPRLFQLKNKPVTYLRYVSSTQGNFANNVTFILVKSVQIPILGSKMNLEWIFKNKHKLLMHCVENKGTTIIQMIRSSD